MTKPMKHLCIISLGSNQGDKLQYLQSGIKRLMQTLGPLERLSPIYETQALGFSGDDFYNACASFRTSLAPQYVMEQLLSIEQEHGRERSKGGIYSSRTLDLDLLFYDELQIDTATLILPHPRLHQRNFVLQPLADIHPDQYHPVLDQSVAKLQLVSPDESALKRLPYHQWTPPIFDNHPQLVIEGNIGSGKTTLTEMIANHYGVKGLYEAFQKNPHLTNFYSDPKTHALAVEKFFLNDRFKQLQNFEVETQGKSTVADYGMHKSLVFARVNLSRGFRAYRREFRKRQKQLRFISLWVYLHRPLEELILQIEERGRSFEQDISPQYLKQLEDSYTQFIREEAPFPVLEIDAQGIDFPGDEEAFHRLLLRIFGR